jgi:hypothetical protein
LTEEEARLLVGNGMNLGPIEALFGGHFFGLGPTKCSRVSYAWAPDEDFSDGGWQLLLPSEHPAKRQKDFLFLQVRCDGRKSTGGEVTNRAS